MRIKQKVIQTAYHFFSEGIILLLLLGPFFHYTYGEVPYWTGLGSLVIVTAVFSLFTQLSEQVIWYLLVAPLVGIGYFYVLDFSLFISIVIVSIFTWRYIVLRQDTHLENENKYLIATTILVIIYVLIARENSALVYFIIQFFTIIIGYITNHTVSMQHHQKKQMTYGLGKLLMALFFLLAVSMGLLHLFGVPILFTFWDFVVVNAWHGIAIGVGYVGAAMMYVLQWVINLLPISDKGQFDSNSAELGIGGEENLEITPVEGTDFNIGWVFTLLLLAFILYQAFKIYRKRFKQEEVDESDFVTHTPLNEKRTRESMVTRLRNRFFRQPANPIRKVMYQFEREAEKREQGRQASETVNEWFERIGLKADTYTYEKVRYGGEQASLTEAKQLSKQLKDWFSQ